jgi:hypothetical protein
VGRDGKSKDEKPEMNEHEKSDHPIVPAKSPNKGTGETPRPAEAVEGGRCSGGKPGGVAGEADVMVGPRSAYRM